MRVPWIALVLALAVAPAADATPKKKRPKTSTSAKLGNHKKLPAKGFWNILVQPNKKWVLVNTFADPAQGPADTITVEPVGIHTVGNATVAHLNWTSGGSDHALAGTHAGLLNQVAVTEAGLYLLPDDADDKRIAEVIKGKPSRSDPPKPYKATKLNEGRYLTIEGDMVCMGAGPEPGAPACDDLCDGEVCISATDGVVALDGNWAPNWDHYEQRAKP